MSSACIRIAVCMLVLVSIGNAADFDKRAKHIIEWGAKQKTTNPKQGFWYAQARFANGMNEEARKMVNYHLDKLHPHDPGFQLWACMDTYFRWKHKYDAPLLDKTKRTMLKTIYFARKNNKLTENKILMLTAACYLSRQAWPDAKFASRWLPDDPDGKKLLLEKMEEYTHRGEREHNSPTYYVHHYGPFRSIADFAKDPVMKNKCALTCEWMLAAAAPQWLDGHWAAPTRRIYKPFRAQNEYRASTYMLWLYFGGPAPIGEGRENAFGIMPAISRYRPPKLFVDIANDRSKEYVHREMHDGGNMKFFTTTYMTPEYAVYSMAEDIPKWPRYNNQVQRWGVCWKRKTGKSVFFVLHPSNTKVKNMGATQFEQVVQHKGTLLSVFDIPEKDPNPHLRGYIPGSPKAVVDESSKGRIYLDYGNVMIAMRLTQSFKIVRGDQFFQTPAKQAGLVVEVVPRNRYATIQKFRAAVAPKFDAAKWTPHPKPSLSYSAIDGTNLEIQFNGTRLVNDVNQLQLQKSWPLLHNPWMHQNHNGDILKIEHAGTTRTYDFKRWKVR